LVFLGFTFDRGGAADFMVTFKDLPEQFSAQRPLIITGVAALLIGIAGTKVVTGRTAEPAPAPTPVAAPVIQSVTALGRLEPNGEIISVSAPSSNDGSRIEVLRVNEGDRVQKGDIIAVLNSQTRLQAAFAQAQGQVRVAEAKLAQVQSGAKSGEIAAQRSEIARLNAEKTGDYNTQSAVVARLEAELTGVTNTQAATRQRLQAEYDNAVQEADRYEKLFVAGATSASLRDSKRLTAQTALRKGEEAYAEANRVRNTLTQQITEAKAALDRSANSRGEQVDAAAATLDRIEEVRPVDVQTAQAEIAQAAAARDKAAADLEQAYVRAPQAGTILKIHTRAGEKIATEGVVDLGQTQQMMALVEVYETDVPRIKLGQTAKVMSDAIGQEVTGSVREIGQKVLRQNVVNTDPTSNTDARVMEVRIELDADSSAKVAKFTNSQVTAKIITDAAN
jgi:HlyD family secretion protein